MDNQQPNQHMLLIGKTGSGKTYLVRAALKAGRFGTRVMVLDIQNQYDEIPLVELEQILEKPPNENSAFYLRIIPDDDDDISDFFSIALALGNVVVIAEEVADYTHNAALLKLLRRGRSEDVTVIAVSQRPADVHKTVTSQVATSIVFHTDEPRDLEYLYKKFGMETTQEVKSLNTAKYEHAVWGDLSVYDKFFR